MTSITELPVKAGVVSVGDHFTDTDSNVHLISNYWGLNSLWEAPLPDDVLDVAFVSTASRRYPELGRPCRFLDAERAWLQEQEEAGRIRSFEYCIAGRTAEEVGNDLSGVDVIFMGGGNTQYLLQELHDTGADDVIRGMVKDGTWYFGKSAGAIVAGPDIDPRGFFLESMATRPLPDTVGLGLTSVYPLPHIDTPSIMEQVHDGKNGWQHAIEMMQRYPTAHILDNAREANTGTAPAQPVVTA